MTSTPRLLRRLAPSRVHDTLAGRLTAFGVQVVPGRLLWFNFALASELGLTTRASMTASLERQVLDAFSLLTTDGESDRQLHADAYGGTGVHPNHGSGRGGYLARGDLFVKGVGRTPLCRVSDFNHSHGGTTLVEAIFESIFGEINHELFTSPSARILAIIDQGRYLQFPDGGREPLGVTVRVGTGLRPAHVLTGGDAPPHPPHDLFCRIANETGYLVRRGAQIDLAATVLRILRDHARTAAEQFRWRILHGAICTSNMRLDGGMLDTFKQSALPRTATARTAEHRVRYHDFGSEHLARSTELQLVFTAVRASLTAAQRRAFHATPVDFRGHMDRMYRDAMQAQWLGAAGLDRRTATRVHERHPALVARFAAVVDELARLGPSRKLPTLPRIGEMPPMPGVDVFALLTAAPAAMLAPPARRTALLREALAPVLSPARARAAARLLASFSRLYPRLIATLSTPGTRTALLRRMHRRASTENRPMDRLFRPRLYRATWDVLIEYVRSNRPESIAGFIEDTVRSSRRRVRDRA